MCRGQIKGTYNFRTSELRQWKLSDNYYISVCFFLEKNVYIELDKFIHSSPATCLANLIYRE